MTSNAVRKIGGEWRAIDAAQNERAERLARYEPKAREAYISALYALQHEEYPGRLVHAAHSLREVIDLLAQSRRPVHQRDKPIGSERKALLQKVFDPLARQAPSTDDSCDVLVKMYKELSAIAHHQATTEEKVRGLLLELEKTLDGLTAPQLAINEEMDEMLSKPPSEKLARQLTGTQNRWATQFRLAENLPEEWLPYMKKAGYFSKPRPAEVTQTPPKETARPPGYFKWPPSLYLRRCAGKRGAEVADIILGAGFRNKSDRNPAVYIDFLACACDLPLPDAEKIAAKALKEEWSDFAGFTLLGERYFELAKKLYLGGRHCIAAEMLFSAARSGLLEAPGAPQAATHPEPQRPAALPNVESFAEMLGEKIIPLAQSSPWPVLDVLGRLLDEIVKLDGQGRADGSDIGDDICDDEAAISMLVDCSYGGYPAWHLLLDRVVGVVAECVGKYVPLTPEGMKQLRQIMSESYKKSHCAFRKIELSVYAEFPGEFALEAGTSMLMHFGLVCTAGEHRRLLGAAFGAISPRAKRAVLDRIGKGPRGGRSGPPADRLGEDTAGVYERRWKLRHLCLIKDHLEGDQLEEYAALLKGLDDPGYPGQAPPDTRPEDIRSGHGMLAGKSVDEVLKWVQEDENVTSEFFAGSTTGIEFEEYVKKNAGECSRRAHEVSSASPSAQRCMISGMDDALREGNNIDWDGALQLIEHVVTARQSHGRASAGSALANAVCCMIERGLKGDFIGIGMKGRVWGIIEALVGIGTDHAEDGHAGRRGRRPGAAAVRQGADARTADVAGTGPLDASLNEIDGLSFHAVYQYAAWCERQGTKKRFFAPEARRVFDSYLDKKAGAHTAARHAVLGVFLPSFYYFDREWARNLPSRIASGREAKAAFWEAYVAWNQLYPHVFKDLLPWYHEFSKKNAVWRNGKRSAESTIVHVMLAHLYGLEGADGPVRNLLGGSDETLQECARQVSIIMRGKADDPDFDKEKLAALWRDEGLARCDLDMWLVNSPLGKRDTIVLYRDYVAQRHGGISLYTPVRHLKPYAEDFPEEVADCLDALVDKCDGYVPDEVKHVLSLVGNSDSLAVKEKCRAIAEKLAQRGR